MELRGWFSKHTQASCVYAEVSQKCEGTTAIISILRWKEKLLSTNPKQILIVFCLVKFYSFWKTLKTFTFEASQKSFEFLGVYLQINAAYSFIGKTNYLLRCSIAMLNYPFDFKKQLFVLYFSQTIENKTDVSFHQRNWEYAQRHGGSGKWSDCKCKKHLEVDVLKSPWSIKIKIFCLLCKLLCQIWMFDVNCFAERENWVDLHSKNRKVCQKRYFYLEYVNCLSKLASNSI